MEEEKAFLGGFRIEDFGNDGGGHSEWFYEGSNNRKETLYYFPLFLGEPRYILSSGGRGLG